MYLYVFISWVLVLFYNIKGVKYAAKVGAKLWNFPTFPSFLAIFLLSSLSTSSSHCLFAFSFTAAFPFYSQSFNDSFCLFQPGYVILIIAVILYVALFLLVVHLDDWARGLAILVDFKTDQVDTVILVVLSCALLQALRNIFVRNIVSYQYFVVFPSVGKPGNIFVRNIVSYQYFVVFPIVGNRAS